MFIADAIPCETGEEFRLNSLILTEDELRGRLSDLGLIVAAIEPARFKADQARDRGSGRGQIHAAARVRPGTADDLQEMESAALLSPASPLGWIDRHALLHALARELGHEAERPADTRRFGLSPVRCRHRAAELAWQWMLEAPEIITDLRAHDRMRGGPGRTPELPLARGLLLDLRRQGFEERAASVERWLEGHGASP